jgi:uncharacterized DUF497 family protein
MRFEWDEEKRRTNLRKHGIDFADAEEVYTGVTVTLEDLRADYGEPRLITVGMLKGRGVVVAHTERHGCIRVISMRKATKNETKAYFTQISY